MMSSVIHQTRRTRIKICGLTQVDNARDVIAEGADAIGLVFYPKSPRYVTPEAAAKLLSVFPPFVMSVGLFVNASEEFLRETLHAAPVDLLQFHGDEDAQQCHALASAVNRPFVRAFRVKPDTTSEDLLECEASYRTASPLFRGLLLDTFVDGFGGSGKGFDWSVIPENLAPRVVLSGGLSVQNATESVTQLRPFAVDISSGVESAKGVKDIAKVRAFIAAIRLGDAQ
jgi:phosphoribosylanthranilate isomerase